MICKRKILALIKSEILYLKKDTFQSTPFSPFKGAPSVCTICLESDHTKSNCPELILPEMVNCPANSRQWLDTLSRICQQVTGIHVYK